MLCNRANCTDRSSRQFSYTKEGGIYWPFHETSGNFKFKQPGALVTES
jgi:hypothetical protein